QLALAAKADTSPAPAQPAEAQADVSIDPDMLTGGDAAAGRRAFFHAAGAGCWRCHTVNGRGGSIGPDLSRIGAMLDRKRLAQSILDPAREVAPQFTVWTFLLESGQTHTGVLVGDVRDSVQKIGTPDGKVLSLKADEIEERVLQRTSLMPARLKTLLTDGELKDLLAYLSSLR
ncbi:MAG: c-type cytochrome, partial [Planctomycetaceae bacterium]|nr:c-type cytochrome [Planctomycetaceae bacterium]